MTVYLDNSATTKVLDPVADMVVKIMKEDYGNPSSMHQKGVEAEHYMKAAKEQIARILKAEEKELLFTSGGTESNNLALIGAALANRRGGSHIITTSVEHPSVSAPLKKLEEEGFRITYLPVDESGRIRMEDLKEAICGDTILISMQYVNHEIGALQPVEETAALIREKQPNIIFHVDAIQAFGKYAIFPKRIGIHLLSVSGHKIHGPKGTGFLYIDKKVKIHPILFGGGQQKGLRSGTENVPGIAGLALAAKEGYKELEAHVCMLYKRKEQFIKGIEKLEGTKINGLTGKDSAPHIVSVSFDGVRSEVLLHGLEEKGVYVSAGSACSSNHKPAISDTLKGIGIPVSYLNNNAVLRFSFSAFTTEDEVAYALDSISELLPQLRRYARR